jgi:uncharacterized phiE125 gp8 family phage protein
MLRLQTGPAAEPLSSAEAKAHLRVSGSGDDAYISALVKAARLRAEQICNRALISQTWDLVLDCWPWGREIVIPLGGVTSVSSVKYHDGTTLQTVSGSLYQVALSGVYARVVPLEGVAWPITANRLEAIEVRFVAGYADAAAVPEAIKQWMLLQIGHMYEHREAASDFQVYVTPFVDGLLDPYRCHVVG